MSIMSRTRNIETVARQRNVFMLLSMLAITTCLILGIKMLSNQERIILVPGLNQEVWTSKAGVSSSYLEETAAMYLPLLLDLDYTSIDWKKERLLSHVSQSDKAYMKSLTDYFAATKEKYKQFSMSTHFSVKKLEINPKDLTVKAYGQLISRFGEKGFETIPAIYGLSFEWIGGKLLLQEFVKLNQEAS
jgi:type IV conjugative transfer system protein TraE